MQEAEQRRLLQEASAVVREQGSHMKRAIVSLGFVASSIFLSCFLSPRFFWCLHGGVYGRRWMVLQCVFAALRFCRRLIICGKHLSTRLL